MKQNKKITPNTVSTIKSIPNQNGAALVITLVVLLVLTIIGIASTDSNQLQAALVRNNQFRLETFNASYSEIDGQVDDINLNSTISGGVPVAIDYLITQKDAAINSLTDTTLLTIKAAHPKMTQLVRSSYASSCLASGYEVGEGTKLFDCHVIQIESEAKLLDAAGTETNIESDQAQRYEYETFSDG